MTMTVRKMKTSRLLTNQLIIFLYVPINVLPALFYHEKSDPSGQVRDNRLYREYRPWNDGIVECWNIGFSGMRSVFIKDGTGQNLKSDHHPFLIPNIPFFQHSIIPSGL
jgi:hypothetical protein